MSYFLYCCFFASVLILWSDSLQLSIRRRKLSKRFKPASGKADLMDPVTDYLGNLASVSFKRDVNGTYVLYVLSAVFFISMVMGAGNFNIGTCLIIAVMACGMPVLLMYLNLQAEQSKSSQEGVSLVSEIYRCYRINNKNVFSALEDSLDDAESYPICRKHVYRLLLHLRSAASNTEIRRACDEFAFALGTVWGSMLASCVRLSAEQGMDVAEGLSDIVSQLKAAGKRAEERKRLNSEAVRMVNYLVPLLYLGTVMVSVKYLGLSLGEYFKNQFLTPEGFLLFLICVFLFVLNLAILRIVGSAKLDY